MSKIATLFEFVALLVFCAGVIGCDEAQQTQQTQSAPVIARFEAERQALTMMDHSSIARVYDAGTTSGEPGGVSPGRPYFVMELVKGVPFTRYCDDNKLDPFLQFDSSGFPIVLVAQGTKRGMRSSPGKLQNVMSVTEVLALSWQSPHQ